MTTIQGTLIGHPSPTTVTVTATLVDLNGVQRTGYVSSESGQITTALLTTPSSAGAWSFDLTPTANIATDYGDTLWRITEGTSSDYGKSVSTYITVPASGGPYWMGAQRTDPPGGAGPVTYAVQSVNGDTGIVTVTAVSGVTISGTPSAGQVPTATSGTAATWQTPAGGSSAASTVTAETSFGNASSAGSASTYSRGDHTHGTPTLPTASTSTAGIVQLDGTAGDIQALGSQAAGATGKAADAGHVHPTTGVLLLAGGTMTGPLRSSSVVLGQVHPGRHGLKAWSWPPTEASTSATATSGTLYLAALDPAESFTSSFLHWHVSVAGVTATAGQNFVGLYASDGTLLASAGVDADVTSTAGARKTALVASLTAGSSYWAAFLFNAATAPQLARGGIATAATSLTNINLTTATLRFATNGTGLTALTSPLVPASNTAGSAFFAAIE